ncbi:M15 family metallopeptidase [Zafaria sp. J156]|uniref:M15 family metallopeptidase n=1 Tax=Zafaria sp. J156 TaxID=3116490 RepID=UPI002E76C149|nr:M15 family metallopeptidase [Zafaria sp. J156]MEE1622342.1 M15 family metallopeptidase [Zafaria sp. J156]
MKPHRHRGAAALAATAVLALCAALPAQAAPSAGPEADATRDPASFEVLVNAENPLDPLDYVPAGLTPAAGSQNLMVPEAAIALALLVEGARLDGHALVVESAYRSYERQAQVFRSYAARYGEAYASKISARPGTSEHQLGLAADVGLAGGQCSLHRCFGDTAAGRWVAAHAVDYGFIIRYPEGAEDATGYAYEPWHLRFLGEGAAADFEASGAASYEEYVAARTTPEPAPEPEPEPGADPAPRNSIVPFLPGHTAPWDWRPRWH